MAKGFGKPANISTRDATKFMQAVMQCIANEIDNEQQAKKKVYRLFQSNLDKLNESLLSVLPSVFTKLTANQSFKNQQMTVSLFLAFGVFIRQFPLGNQSLNCELSIVVTQLSLRVFNPDSSLENWAEAQVNLGNAFAVRIRGNRAENLEQAIATYELALQVYTREAFPEDWARTQLNLGVAYSDRIRGDRADNIEKAIDAYKLALQVYTREAFPKNWAGVQNNLGNVYGERIRGDRAENLEKSITAHESALQVYTREAFPENWAGAQNNLGNRYSDLIRGNRSENLEKSITAYDLALQVYTREAFPEDWAMVQNNLGNAYRNRILGNQIDNIEQAISFHQQAAQVFTREAFPNKWAENQANLAEAFAKRASLANDVADLDTAIELFQEALEVAVPGSPDFIDSQYRLGNALSRRYEHNKNPEDLEQALRAYQIALDAINPEHYDRSQIWQALPTTQSILGSRLVRDGQWQEGLKLLLNSVEQLRTGDDILAHANALFQTGYAHETLSDWENARLYYRDALRLYDHINDQLGIAQSRAGLGSVLVSQGSLQKGMAELEKAIEVYRQLKRLDRVAELENLYQVAQKAWERQASEVYA